jgi:quinol monooxygenase YgiN
MNMMKLKTLAVLLIFAGTLTNCTSKKPAGNANISDPPKQTTSMDYKMMIVAKLSVKPEKTKDFIEAAKEIIEKSNKEAGCSFYQLYQDPYDNSKFVFVEEYKNQAAVDFHFATDHFKAFGPKIGDLVLGPPEIKIVSIATEVTK